MTEVVRVQVLEEAAKLTSGDRDKTYGPPHINMGLAGKLKDVFWDAAKRHFSYAEREALDMVLTKLSRIATGPEPHRDNYVDAAAYMAIAYECATLPKDEKVNSYLKGMLEGGPPSLFQPLQGKSP